jgi:phage/plasmid-like protein (TIGR03299 family)
MAHLIETNQITKKAEIAYIGKKPWHGLGQELTPNAPIEVWQKEAGLDWSAKLSPVLYTPEILPVPYKDRFVIYRNDTNNPLGIVTDRYQIHQPQQILDFFNTLVNSAGFTLEVAGAIKGGKRIWALANVNKEACVFGDDVVKAYLLLSTSFDGSMATIGQFTSVRVVCNNTLNAADNEVTPSRISITHGHEFDHFKMRDKLGIMVNGFDGMMDGYRKLANESVNKNFVHEFLNKLFPPIYSETKNTFIASSGYNKVFDLFDGKGMGSDLPHVHGTKWGLLNAVTEHIDHERGHNVNNRINNAWFGNGARVKNLAEKILLA